MARDPARLEPRLERRTFVGGREPGNGFVQYRGIAVAVVRRREARIPRQRIVSEYAAQLPKTTVVLDSDRDPPVDSLHRVTPVRGEHVVAVAAARRVGIVDQNIEHRWREEVQRSLGLRQIDVDAFAGASSTAIGPLPQAVRHTLESRAMLEMYRLDFMVVTSLNGATRKPAALSTLTSFRRWRSCKRLQLRRWAWL
jgi:hypothetical protein